MIGVMFLVKRIYSGKNLIFSLINGVLANDTEGYRINGDKPWEIDNCQRFFDEMGFAVIETEIID